MQQSRPCSCLAAADLLNSFGCVELLRSFAGEWLVLEVNTDGIAAVVDRDIGIPGIPEELDQRLAAAFHAWSGALDP